MSNTFGKNLNWDIDDDGNNDSAVILDNIIPIKHKSFKA